MSRIGINLLYINPKLAGGTVTYALKLIKEISLLDNNNQYVIYINKECKSFNFVVGDNFKFRILNFDYSSVYLRYFWEQLILPFYIFFDKIDLIHSLGYVTPLITTCKKVVTIHDINYMGHASNMSIIKRILLGSMVNLSALFCNHIITISKFSRDQIIKYTYTFINKITITLLSGSSDLVNTKHIEKELIFKKYNIDSEYIISFSSTSTHKNIEKLIMAFEQIVLINPNLKLVLVGHLNKSNDLNNCIKRLNLSKKIIFTGFVPDQDINPLLNYAKIFVFPSLYEGFGIPLLDAQFCEVPVVSSNAGSLPEVGGDDVFYFDPTSINNMCEVISTALKVVESDKIIKIRNKGLENRNKFSWEKTAQQTLDVYKKVLNNNR
jgi:glycosyltransferase involved in cell wall biosynthesis